MTKKTKTPNSIEKINDSVRNRETFAILKGIGDNISFGELVKWFSSKKEQNKIILSWFLNSTNIDLAKLWDIKIDINHIKNYIRNKPDIPKDLEIKIAKLYLKKLYDVCETDYSLITKLNSAFDINVDDTDYDLVYNYLKDPSTIFLSPEEIAYLDKDEDGIITENDLQIIEKINLGKTREIIENKNNIDFKTIRVDINKLWDKFVDKINSITVSNDEIFDLLGNDINKYTNFQSQSISSQPIILDLLNFEVKWVIDYVKSWWKNAEKDMEDMLLPTNTIWTIFDKVQDLDIANLLAKRWKLEDLQDLVMTKDIFKDKISLKKYIKKCKKAWLDENILSELKKLLLWKIDEKKVKDFYKKEINKINKEIWRKYIENFEKMWTDSKFTTVLKKLIWNNFDFSKLEKNEQTALWQTLVLNKFDQKENTWAKFMWLDQEQLKSSLKDLYDFEQDEINIDVKNVWSLNLHIKKEVKSGENENFQNPDNFKNVDATNQIVFTVNIDDNDETLIKDLEETEDSPLRVDGIMETHTTLRWEINIWNGYTLEICGKKITKSQLDDLLLCKDLPELNEKLKELWLFEELKDEVYSTRKEIFKPQNVYTNLDEDWFDTGRWDNSSTISYSDEVCIFEEVLKKLDVKVIKRDLIFEWKNIDKLHQIYILSKLWWKQEKERQEINERLTQHQDEKINKIFGTDTSRLDKPEWEKKQVHEVSDASRHSDEELGDVEAGKPKADALWKKIKRAYEDYINSDDEEDGTPNFSIYDYDDSIYEDAERYRNELDDDWKKAFKERLEELCNTDPDIEENRDDVRWEIDNLIEDLENPSSHASASTDDWETWTTQPEKSEADKVKEFWDGLQWDKECLPFSVWTVLYFDLWESQLPPKDITDAEKSFYAFEIVASNDENFTMRAIWWDLKSSLAGKECTIEKKTERLDELKKSWSIYKVKKSVWRGRDACLKSINSAWFFKKLTTFWDMEWQVKLEWNKFVNQKWEEVKYFDRVEWVFDDSNDDKSKRWQWEKIYKYEIKKIDTVKWTVQLTSKFDWHDDNYNDIVYEYENEIPFEQFILLMEWKRLKGYTQAEQDEMETKYNIADPKRLATKWMRKWISIWSIINVFKNTTKAIKAKVDERNKQQEEDLENFLFSYEWLDLYWKLWSLFWNSALWDAIRQTQYEFYTNRENRTWKRIEQRYKIFETDPNYSEFFAEHLQDILWREWYVWNDNDRYKFAAAFLIMVKKEWPYPRVFANQKDKWKRVENILWPEHKIRFLNFYEKKKNALEQEKDMWHQSWARLALQEELNKMEIQYIISTIDWRAPYSPCSNEFMLKSIRSLKFMSTLEENIKWYYNKHDEEKSSLETFYSAEESYLRNLWSWKFQKALPALERMCETAKTPWEVFRIKWYLLGAMLMWIIKNNSSAKTIKSFWWTCRAMWFAPWYWMRDIEQQDKVKGLLDWVTNGEFSANPDLKYNVSDFEPGNIKDWKYSFWKIFQWYWNSHGEDILKKIENPTYKNDSSDKSIIDLANEKNNPNNYIFKDIIKNSTTNEIDTMWEVNPIFSQESPLSATSNMVKQYIPRNGKYSKLKSEEDLSNAEDFWTKARDAIPGTATESNQETVDFMFKKFFNRFDDAITTDIQKPIIRSLPLIQKEYNKWNYNNAKYMLWYMLKGNMYAQTRWSFPTEFNQVMDKFFDFFYKNINKINKNTIRSTFDDGDLRKAFDNEYELLWWWKFYRRYMNWQWNDRNRYKKNAELELFKKNKDWTDTINYKIDEIWKKTKEYDTPNIPFDPDSDLTLKVWDLPINKVQEQMNALGDSLYSLVD